MLSLMAAAHWLRQVSFHRWVGILQGPSLGVVLFRGYRTSPVVPTATSASDYLRYVYVQQYRLLIWYQNYPFYFLLQKVNTNI